MIKRDVAWGAGGESFSTWSPFPAESIWCSLQYVLSYYGIHSGGSVTLIAGDVAVLCVADAEHVAHTLGMPRFEALFRFSKHVGFERAHVSEP